MAVGNEFGQTLRTLRESAGQSLLSLAKRTNWSKAAIGHAETGKRTPSPELARALDNALGAKGVLIALAASVRDQRKLSDVRRRELLRAIAVGGASLTAPTLATDDSHGRIGQAEVKSLLDRTARLRRLDDALGGADTFGLFLAEMEATERLLGHSTYSSDTHRALLAVLAEQGQLAGWAAFDAGWLNRSEDLYVKSHAAAREARDQGLFANAFALAAYQRAFSGHVDIAVVEASIDALNDTASPARFTAASRCSVAVVT